MEFKPQIEKTIDRYKRLWNFEPLEVPITMIDIPKSSVSTHGNDCTYWQNPEAFVNAKLESLSIRQEIPDDTIPMLRPPFSHTALPAALGAQPEMHNGKLWVNPIFDELTKNTRIELKSDNCWLEKVETYYKQLIELSDGRFAVGLYDTPAPADLIGALRGFEQILFDLYDRPQIVKKLAVDAAKAAAEFNHRLYKILAKQENYGGTWAANSWVPADTIYFCEHCSVNYSPQLYDELIKPANAVMLADFGHAVTFAYCTAGHHHIDNYFNRPCPVWLRSCDGDAPSELIKKQIGKTIVTIHTTSDRFDKDCILYGTTGICYRVSCKSLNEAQDLCKSIGL